MDSSLQVEGVIAKHEPLSQLEKIIKEQDDLIRQLQARLEEAEKLNIYDPLCRHCEDLAFRVLNHEGTRRSLDGELERIKRHGRFTLLFLDLDNFKPVNDTLGHTTGDDLLRKIAQILVQHIRGVDIIGRPGGDEFIIGLVDTNEEGGLEVAERLREILPKEIRKSFPNLTISQTVSIGLTQAKENDTVESLIERADFNLLQAKETKNYVVAG